MEMETESTDSNQAEDDGINPMHTPLIVERIFNFLPLSALKECRLVSRFWNNVASEQMQEDAWISLKSDETFQHGLTNFFNFAKQSYEEPEDILFRNFRLKYINITEQGHAKTRLPEFWSGYGPCIETLHLKRCCVSKDLFRKVISSDWTPNMKHLILEECPFIERSAPAEVGDCDPAPSAMSSSNNIRKLTFQSDKSQFAQPFNLSHLWTLFPKLTDLCLTDISEEECTEILEAAVDWKKEHKKPLPVTKLNIFGEEKYSMRKIPNHNFELLCISGFPLTRLQLDIGECVEEAQFGTLIKTFSRTLETLIIWRGLLASRVRGFPYSVILPRLRTLEIPDSCVEDLKFIRYMKGLRKLSILQCDMEPIPYETDLFHDMVAEQDGGARELDPLPGLNFLKIEFKMTEPEIEFVRYVFPKLIQLSAFVGKEFVTLSY